MAGELNFVMLHVKEIAAARAFYAETFGLEVVDENPYFVQFGVAGGAMFALEQDEHAAPTQTLELWWQVPDVDAAHATLASRGVEIVSAPKDEPFGRALSVKDPEGNTVNLYQPKQA
jgi:predicted enzyme related to lactoylglutathione lyase